MLYSGSSFIDVSDNLIPINMPSKNTSSLELSNKDNANKVLVMDIAESLDNQQLDGALELLSQFPVEQLNGSVRRLIISLWRRLVNLASIEGEIELSILEKFEGLDQQFSQQGIDSILSLSQKVESDDIVSPLTSSLLFKYREQLHVGQLWTVINIAMAGGYGNILFNVWQLLVQKSPDYVIDYWEMRQLILSSDKSPQEVFANIASTLIEAKRDEQLPLLEIYQDYFFNQQLEKFVQAGIKLKGDGLKEKILLFVLGVGLSESQTAAIYPDVKKLLKSIKLSKGRIQQYSDYLDAKFFASKQDWEKVYESTETPPDNHLLVDSRFFHALSLLKLGHFNQADRVINQVLSSPECKYFHRHSAAQIGAQINCLRQGEDYQTEFKPPKPEQGTRPLVQALWVGPKLRWVERLSISSFLQQGWRYQLYVYNLPEGVPKGVELMDATTILPREMIFKEEALSAAHKGSLGAFSDLFRYKLLLKKGGLWADTDILNLKLFEPEGLRFMSTEVVTCGIEGLNGAMLASPVNDPLVKLAYAKALELVNKKQVYFTRIGPQLLAELVYEYGKMGFLLAKKSFLNPLGWMEIGMLADDFDSVANRLKKQKPHNVHLYTESWRISGLSLDTKPDKDSFIGTFYAAYLENDQDCLARVKQFIGKL